MVLVGLLTQDLSSVVLVVKVLSSLIDGCSFRTFLTLVFMYLLDDPGR